MVMLPVSHIRKRMTDPNPITLQFSTADYPGKDGIEAWRHLFGRAICDLDIEPLTDQPFHSRAVVRVLPGLGVASGVCSGAHYWRPQHLIKNDDLVFVFNHDGVDRARMLGRESIIEPGQAVLFATDTVGGTTNKSHSRFTTIRIPRATLAPAMQDMNAAVLQPIVSNNIALSLLRNYISVLENPQALAKQEAQNLVVSHIHDLIVLALGPTKDAGQLARKRGVRAARLHAIKADVARQAENYDLSISSIAARHGVTPRYIQMLFGEAGTSFSEYIGMQRLAAAHRMLADPASSRRKISEVALTTGFSSVSYFNRAFRRQFDVTPTDVRTGARPFEPVRT